MTENEIVKVSRWLSKGAKLYVGRDHSGRQKIKVVHGPFGIFVDRFQCDEKDIARLKVRPRDAITTAA